MTIDGSGIAGGATNLGSSKSGVNVTVTSSTGTNTTFSVADNDNSPTNEIQSLGLSGTTLTISGGGGSQSLASIASKWTDQGAYINTMKGVAIGITNASVGTDFWVNTPLQMNNGNVLRLNESGNRGNIYGSSSTGLNVEATSGNDLRLIGGNVVMKVGSDFASNTIVIKSANFTLPSASGYPNGTVKKVIN